MDEYILMAKEKHGYNMEQVKSSARVTVCFLSPFSLSVTLLTCYIAPTIPLGSRHVVVAQARCGALPGRPRQLHPLPRRVDSGG